jgi:hypothetical protein
MDKTIIITIVLIILAGFLFWGFQSGLFAKVFSGPPSAPVPTPLPEGLVLFYGNGCPHCKIVEDFISQNNIDQKVKLTKLEVWYDKSNQATLIQVAGKCGISADTVGIPLLYDPSTSSGQAGKCYVGETDVTNFLKNAAGIK